MQPVLSSVLLRGLGALAGDPEIASVVTDSREAVSYTHLTLPTKLEV